MIIYHATINHRHGNNQYNSTLQADLRNQILEYVKSEWSPEMEGPLPSDDGEALDRYFSTDSNGSGEFIEYWEDEVPDLDPWIPWDQFKEPFRTRYLLKFIDHQGREQIRTCSKGENVRIVGDVFDFDRVKEFVAAKLI